MKSFQGPPRPRAWVRIFYILFSFSLTAYIDLYALDSDRARLLVFCCSLAAWEVLSRIVRRLSAGTLAPETVLSAVAAAFLIMVGCRGVLFPPTQETYITLVCETAGEICLCDVVVDEVNIPVAEAEVVENIGWLYREQYDNFMIWPEVDGVENRLTLRFDAEKVHLGFPYTPYAGSVTITSSLGGKGKTLNLRCPEWKEGEAVRYADIPIDCNLFNSPLEYLLYGTGILSALSGLCLIVLLAYRRLRLLRLRRGPIPERREDPEPENPELENPEPEGQERRSRSGRRRGPLPEGSALLPGVRRRAPAFIVLAVVHYLLFYTFPKITPDGFTTVFLILLAAASCLSLFSPRLEGYKTRSGAALVAAVALYASLASFGQRFFLDGNTRMHFSAEGAFCTLLGTVWFIPVVCMLLAALERLASVRRPAAVIEPARRQRAFGALLAIMCLCQAVILWSFWPGGFPADCLDLMNQAVGPGGINNWHPALNAICYRLILSVFPHAGALVAVQLFFFALLCTEYLMLGYDRGVPFQALAVLGAAACLMPNQVIFGISPLKDYPYTLALLWAAYLMVRLALDPAGELSNWRFLAALPLSLFLVYGFRHNGVVPFAALLLLFGWITLRRFPEVRYRLAGAGLAAVLLVAAYKGPVFDLLNIPKGVGMSPYTTMLCAAASCVNKDLPLSEKSTAIMESVLPLDQWADYYDRYSGHDPYYWGRGELGEAYPYDPSHITAKEAFTVYLEALFKYPDVVIKDRLDGMDLMWDVRQPSDGFNAKGFYGTVISSEDVRLTEYFGYEPMVPGEHYYNDSRLAMMYQDTVNTPANSVLDMLLWRSGAYLILLMALGLFWWKNRMRTLFWAAAPLLGQIAGLMLVLYHQSYRYVSAIQMLTVALVFCSVCLGGSRGRPRAEESSSASGGEELG